MAGLSTPEYYVELGSLEGLKCFNDGPSPGAIAGIVIGCILGFLILLCLILLVILMIVRITQKKHPIPSRQEMRTMASNFRGNIRERFTMKHVNHDSPNALYSQGAQNVGFSNNNKDREAMVGVNAADHFRINSKEIDIGDVLAEGKFAVVSRAYCTRNNTKDSVAAKALRSGFTQSDMALMASKIRFMKEVTPHRNLVKFIGFVDDSPDEGQIMVLELCDFPLKNWFENKPSLSTDDLEQMLGFTLNIAEGVAHLHSIKKLHRRLAMRNVLLKGVGHGLVAKLIGFGPNSEDGKSGTSSGETSSLPLKWLAPETLDSSKKSTPTYTEKTDAWSFGVTIWEMYSKGAAPYANVRSQDIKDHLKQGHRLQCPTECPPDLFAAVVQPCWKQSPSGRPTFITLVRDIQKFRSGPVGGDGAYYAANDDDQGGDQYYAQSELYSDGR